MTQADRRASITIGAAAAVFAALAVGLFWPGYVAYDSVAQYRQALTGRYDDWHPPAMALLWSLFGDAGPAPMLILQMALYWAGFGALAMALRRTGRRGAALAVIAIALWPPLLGWQAVVLKDTQMLAALLGATGVAGWWRLRDRPVPPLGWAIVVLLFAYAMLVRANAVFAAVPLAVMLSPLRRWTVRIPMALAGILMVIALSGAVNHRLFGATPSGVERTQAIYDLTGIGVRTRDPRVGLSSDALAAIAAKHCLRPFFWDPLGEPARCEPETAPLRTGSAGALYLRLASAIMHHPVAYAQHRLAHWNATGRWWVPLRWIGADPPGGSEPNDYRFGEPGAAARTWQGIAAVLVETPLCWPILWVVMAIGGLAAARGEAAAVRLARALFVSALTLEASFAAISIASDLRYHLWSMTAAALGWVLLGRMPRGRWLWTAIVLVVGVGSVARLVLPQQPQTYRGMLG
jgi:hypothetical protein